MSYTFQGYQLVGGQIEPNYTSEATILWGREQNAEYVAVVLDADTQDSGRTDTTSNTMLRTGLALGKITSTNQFTHWDPYATDGSNYLVGFLLDEIDMAYAGSTKERVHAVVLKGNIKASQVVIPGLADRGISGTTYEFLLREQCVGRFLFDDDLGAYNADKTYALGATTAAYSAALTVTAAMNRTTFITDSALDADVTLTLPAPRPGLQYQFVHPSTTAGTELILDGPATSEFWIAGAVANTLTIPGDNATTYKTLKCMRVNSTPTYCYVLQSAVA